MKLLDVSLDCDVRVMRFTLAEHLAAYLRGVGIREGVLVHVVRRAPFGGPLFVRASSGAEVAVGPEIAAGIETEAP